MYQKKIAVKHRCPLDKVMNIFSGKWSPSVFCLIIQLKSVRYTDFHSRIDGISDPVLASTLKHLIKNGLVERKVYDEMPMRVEYVCSEKGELLIPIFQELCRWSKATQENQKNDFENVLPNCEYCDCF